MINTYTPCYSPLITACYHCTVHTHTCTYTYIYIYIYIYCLLSLHTHIRGRSYQFEEFLLTWGDRLRSGGKMTAITAGLQRDVDKYQVPYQSALSWRKLCPSPLTPLSPLPPHSTLPPPPSLHQALLPLLKYVKGEVLSPEHWHEMFHMLGFPRGTTLEKLSFGDILTHVDDIVSNADRLKELYRSEYGIWSFR